MGPHLRAGNLVKVPIHGDRGRSLCPGQETDAGTSHTWVLYSEHLSFASKNVFKTYLKRKKEKKIKLHLCSLLGQNTSTDPELTIK